jgi:acyl CoA:acetate/3-ketoacid CoA transferase beta subunit
MSDATRAEVCSVAIAEAFRGDGEMMVSPFGNIPAIGARLAKLTFEPDLVLTDGIATIVDTVQPVGGAEGPDPIAESWMPFRTVFDTLWSGRRHAMMMATQIDRFGNQNFARIGSFEKPRAQLLGMRGAPGNTLNHPNSYWVPNHSTKSFVEKVDTVSGVGFDRAAALGERSSRFHDVRRVISNLGVFDFATPDHSMHLVSVHPGVSVEQVVENTAFELMIDDSTPDSRWPTDDELRIMREILDPNGVASAELPG